MHNLSLIHRYTPLYLWHTVSHIVFLQQFQFPYVLRTENHEQQSHRLEILKTPALFLARHKCVSRHGSRQSISVKLLPHLFQKTWTGHWMKDRLVKCGEITHDPDVFTVENWIPSSPLSELLCNTGQVTNSSEAVTHSVWAPHYGVPTLNLCYIWELDSR